jgi:hypothetical protein
MFFYVKREVREIEREIRKKEEREEIKIKI